MTLKNIHMPLFIFERQHVRERENTVRGREIFCWFTHQMPVVVLAVPGWSQEPRITPALQGGSQLTDWQSHYSLLSRVYISKKMESKVKPELEPVFDFLNRDSYFSFCINQVLHKNQYRGSKQAGSRQQAGTGCQDSPEECLRVQSIEGGNQRPVSNRRAVAAYTPAAETVCRRMNSPGPIKYTTNLWVTNTT